MNAGFEESSTHAVDLPDDDPDTIKRVLAFMYLQNYDDGSSVQTENETEAEKPFTSLFGKASVKDPDSNNPEDSSEDVDHRRFIAYNNIRVYVTADKFGIVPLRSLAGEKFASWANSNWNCAAFSDIVQEVMTYVPPHDTYLRDVVIDTISKNIISLVREGTILPLMDTNGKLGSAVIAKLVGNGRIKASEEEQATTLDRLASKLTGRRSCRHCSATLNVRMERGEYEYGTFRCATCSTRH
ncbi:hypothetical protein Plec18167_002574 [Paecilomyces lecythidis]|uniref:Uncharacterized protein n=1 Tax=Paecilomyces lecythidis TaxID=3004212 RepID=A0ABR3Y5J4_9EURO